MNTQKVTCMLFLLLFCGLYAIYSQTVPNDPFFELCRKHAQADGTQRAVKGRDDWFFLKNELVHLSKKEFWGDSAGAVSESASSEWSDPLRAIIDFNNQLDARNIELILLPIPAKAVAYPEKLDGMTGIIYRERLDYYHYMFYEILKDNGVNVIDLLPLLLESRKRSTEPVYCRTDAHWSPYAAELAAIEITKIIRRMAWYDSVPVHELRSERKRITISGDLVRDEDSPVSEDIGIRVITDTNNEFLKNPDASPVILMGDSHTLIFHEGGDMLSKGAGLADQLAYELKFPVDLVGVRGSGSTAARVNLFRKSKYDPAYLSGKKVVIWCFSVREFTESTGGWKIVPVSPK